MALLDRELAQGALPIVPDPRAAPTRARVAFHRVGSGAIIALLDVLLAGCRSIGCRQPAVPA
jgi:hypothetical protein